MDKATVIGLILGCLTLGGALLLGHAPLQALIQPEALLMVFGGTATAVLVSFSTRTLGAAWTGFVTLCVKTPSALKIISTT